jgi:hypothetical protein
MQCQEAWLSLQISISLNIIYVNEDDISQIYVGLMCNHFILSDSTYHWWIAFLKWSQDNSVSVYAFNDTDTTNRCLINSTLKTQWKFVDIIPDDSFVFIHKMDHHNDDVIQHHLHLKSQKFILIIYFYHAPNFIFH